MTTQLESTLPPPVAPRAESAAHNAHSTTVAKQPYATSQPLYRRLRTGAVWVVLSRSLGIVITMLVNMALARWLSPEAFGSFLLLSSVLAMGTLLAMLGLNVAVVRFVSGSLGRGDVGRARQVLWQVFAVAAVAIASVAGISAAALTYYGANRLGLADVGGIVPLAVTSLVLLSVLQLSAEACRSLHEMRLASLFSGGQSGGLLSNVLFLLLIAAAMVIGKPSLGAAIALNLIAMGITLPLAVFGFFRAARTRLVVSAAQRVVSPLTLGQLLGFSIPMVMIQLLNFTATNADLWVAGVNCAPDQLALYAAARRLMLIVTMPLQMVVLTVISSIAELHVQDRHRDLELLLRRATTAAALPSVGAIALLIFFGGPILVLLFGPYFRQAALPLGILGVGQLFLVLAGTCGSALEMAGYQIVSLVINLITAIALVTLGSWAAVHFGILGLAIASASIVTTQSVTLWLLAKRLVGVWTHPALSLISLAELNRS
jgi:O-antigen/teichoic acid export membrane protein